MSTTPIQIAVVGHTNTGKTSLLRTLTRDEGFGEVSPRSATTRDVQGVALLAEGREAMVLYDTPGLEDASGLAALLAQRHATAADPVAAIEAFLAGDHDQGRYEQEAKVLRKLLHSDAALVVIDAREPVLAKHREELRLLAACGRPLMPVLNFVADVQADAQRWQSDLARVGLHVWAAFDTVVYDHAAEQRVFEKLAVLLEARRGDIQRLLRAREREREERLAVACRSIARLLVDAAALRVRGPLEADAAHLAHQLRTRVIAAEQACVDELLALFRFDLHTWQPPQLPLEQGRWALDAFDPETMRRFGIRAGSAAAAGGAAGLAVDAAVGGMSLGAAALLGAALGAGWSGARTFGQPWIDRVRGHQERVLEEPTLALLAVRQLQLLEALLRRGHASRERLHTGEMRDGWVSAELRAAVLRCRAHPGWSRLNPDSVAADEASGLPAVVAALRHALALRDLPSDA